VGGGADTIPYLRVDVAFAKPDQAFALMLCQPLLIFAFVGRTSGNKFKIISNHNDQVNKKSGKGTSILHNSCRKRLHCLLVLWVGTKWAGIEGVGIGSACSVAE
jgi:hypothetical protein